MGKTGKTNTAVYTVIYAELRNRIFSGQFHPGDLLPSESQLCAEYDVSRETLRKGLKMLENEGLIYSRSKIGYFVSTPNHSDFTVTFSDASEDCTVQYKDIHGILPNEQVRKALEISADQKVIEFSQVTRNKDGEPLAFDIKYVPYEKEYPSVESEIRFAVFPDITLSKISSYDYYTDITIKAVNASPEIARLLECEPQAALMLIERIFIKQDGRHIAYSLHYCKGNFGELHGTAGYKQ